VEALVAGYLTLSYDSYRRLALTAGTEPVTARGAKRALRRAHRQARPAG
jgi:hypothetical protein